MADEMIGLINGPGFVSAVAIYPIPLADRIEIPYDSPNLWVWRPVSEMPAEAQGAISGAYSAAITAGTATWTRLRFENTENLTGAALLSAMQALYTANEQPTIDEYKASYKYAGNTYDAPA